jgi:hypothetical protein
MLIASTSCWRTDGQETIFRIPEGVDWARLLVLTPHSRAGLTAARANDSRWRRFSSLFRQCQTPLWAAAFQEPCFATCRIPDVDMPYWIQQESLIIGSQEPQYSHVLDLMMGTPEEAGHAIRNLLQSGVQGEPTTIAFVPAQPVREFLLEMAAVDKGQPMPLPEQPFDCLFVVGSDETLKAWPYIF